MVGEASEHQSSVKYWETKNTKIKAGHKNKLKPNKQLSNGFFFCQNTSVDDVNQTLKLRESDKEIQIREKYFNQKERVQQRA